MNSNQSKLILVVDDSSDNRTLMNTLLRSNGWSVMTAADGLEALEMLEQASRLPDLILLDMQMPGMNGAEFRRNQIQKSRIKNIPVIVMSASCSEEAIRDIAPDGLLAKPLNLKTVIKNVGSFLH